MEIHFEKWHGCHNDFIIIHTSCEQKNNILPSLQKAAKYLCSHSGAGIGADGLLLLCHPQDDSTTNTELVIINQDGSLADNCGNGLRCAAAAIFNKIKTSKHNPGALEKNITLQIKDQEFICYDIEKNHLDSHYILIQISTPTLDSNNPWHDKIASFCKTNLSPQPQEVRTCTLGNKHLVLFVEQQNQKLCDNYINTLRQQNFSAEINTHVVSQGELTKDRKHLCEKILGQTVSEVYELTPWERGCGYTQACGSGACSAASLALSDGLIERNKWLMIAMPGGDVFVKQSEENANVQLLGPAKKTFVGSFIL